MTHDTPPKRIAVGVTRSSITICPTGDTAPEEYIGEYTLTSEADAMVAAALREAATKVQGEANAANRDAEDAHQRGFSESAFHIRQHAEAMASVIPALEALIPQPASAALDKLIAEAVQAERAIWTQAIETYFDATAVEDVELHVAALRAALTTGENDD